MYCPKVNTHVFVIMLLVQSIISIYWINVTSSMYKYNKYVDELTMDNLMNWKLKKYLYKYMGHFIKVEIFNTSTDYLNVGR